jgi:outer membrane immunogenic protein
MTANDSLSISTSQSAFGGFATAQALGLFPLRSAPNSGFIGGVQGGYGRMVFDAIYVGAETDFQLLSAQNSVSSNPIAFGQQSPMSVTRSQTWLGTTRAKIGYAPMPSLLIYGTGGLAYGDSSLSVSITSSNVSPPAATSSSTTQTHLGFAVGAGLEANVWGPISVKGEWLYYDLGSTSVSNGYIGNSSTMTTTVLENGHIFRAGVNYRF